MGVNMRTHPCVTPRGRRRFLRRPHRRLKLQQVDFRRRAELSVHLRPLPYALALAPTAESSPAPENFFQKRLSQKGYPFLGQTVFGQAFSAGGGCARKPSRRCHWHLCSEMIDPWLYPTAGTRGPLDRVAQVAERKHCRPGFPRKVPVFPICSPATWPRGAPGSANYCATGRW
jgi:hypothetical protein